MNSFGIMFTAHLKYCLLAITALFSFCSVLKKVQSSDPFGSPAAITTDFSNARQDYTLPEDFSSEGKPQPLTRQAKSSNGGYLLSPGFYEATCRSYCLHAGTYGPSKGDGYLYAPLKGPKKEIIETIVRNSANKIYIPQTTVQLLIWAVLAKTNFKNLSTDLKAASIQLLSPQQLLELNGGALGILPGSVVSNAMTSLPEPAKQAVLAENKMRQLFEQANTSYADVERIAVRSRNGIIGKTYARGGWSKHPNGYYVRYFPDSYRQTRVQVYVPERAITLVSAKKGGASAQIGFIAGTGPVEFDASGDVAVPANTDAQRLQQSNTPVDGGAGDAGNGDAGPPKNKKCLDPNDLGKTIHAKNGKHYKLYNDKVLECPNLSLDGCGLPWWTNNPGNLTAKDPKNPTGQLGSIPNTSQKGPDPYYFLIFPDYAAGYQALLNVINQSGDRTILQEMEAYAPKSDPLNNPTKYAQDIAKALGGSVTVDTKIKDLKPEQIPTIAKTIQQIEGYNNHPEGKEYSPDDPSLPQEVKDKYKTCP